MKTQQPFDLLHAYQQTRAEMRTGYGQHSFELGDTLPKERANVASLILTYFKLNDQIKYFDVKVKIEDILMLKQTPNRTSWSVVKAINTANYIQLVNVKLILKNKLRELEL